MPKLTKSFVDAATAKPDGSDAFFWDSELRGFGLRVKATGVRSWLVQYRNKAGQSKRLTIGQYGEAMPPKAARDLAIGHLAAARAGKDPAADRKGARDALTVGQLCDEYLAASKAGLKPSTHANDKGRINCHIRPLLGSRTVESLKASDIEKFVNGIVAGKTAKERPTAKRKGKPGNVASGGKGAATRAAGLLRTILQRAVKDKIITHNPASGIKLPKEEARLQPFTFERVAAVGSVLRDMASEQMLRLGTVPASTQTVVRVVRFLILSGCRKSEALTLQWGDVDAPAHCLRLRDSKTGRQSRPLGSAALDFLASFRPRDASPKDYVFPGASKAGHYVGLAKAWERIAKRAEVPEITPHGLRHWFGSAAAEMNYSDFIIGGMLGHAKRGITGRYANAPDHALVVAADRVSQRLADTLDGRKPAKVLNFTGAA